MLSSRSISGDGYRLQSSKARTSHPPPGEKHDRGPDKEEYPRCGRCARRQWIPRVRRAAFRRWRATSREAIDGLEHDLLGRGTTHLTPIPDLIPYLSIVLVRALEQTAAARRGINDLHVAHRPL